MNATWARQCLIKSVCPCLCHCALTSVCVLCGHASVPFTPHTSWRSPCATTPPTRVRNDYKYRIIRTGLRGQSSVFAVEEWRLGLWVWRSQKRNVIPTSSDQRRTAVLFSIHQRLWKGFAFALREKQDGENRQQGQRRVDHMVQKVAVVITQIHERRTEAAHATQSHDRSHTTSSVDTRMEH